MEAVPGGRAGKEVLARGGNNTWAPDVIRSGDKYFIYYSAPATQPRAAIGLLIGRTLDPASPAVMVHAPAQAVRRHPSLRHVLATRLAPGPATGLALTVVTAILVAGAVLLSVPFLVGVVSLARRLGGMLAEVALPLRTDGKVDLAAAPRRRGSCRSVPSAAPERAGRSSSRRTGC